MSEKYAIIQLGGKQFKVVEGSTLKVDHQIALSIDVLAYSNGSELTLGAPFMEDVTVKAELDETPLSKKTTVSRFRSKSRHRRKLGHKQPLSLVTISSISLKGEKVAKEDKKVLESTDTAKAMTDAAKPEKKAKVSKKGSTSEAK